MHNISFYGIQFMNTRNSDCHHIVFANGPPDVLGSVPDFSLATACTLIPSGLTEFLAQKEWRGAESSHCHL